MGFYRLGVFGRRSEVISYGSAQYSMFDIQQVRNLRWNVIFIEIFRVFRCCRFGFWWVVGQEGYLFRFFYSAFGVRSWMGFRTTFIFFWQEFTFFLDFIIQFLWQREEQSYVLYVIILYCRYTEGKRFRKWKELNLKRATRGDGRGKV